MGVQAGKRYRHYKNQKEYEVLMVAFYTEKEPIEECVVYRALYDDPQLGERPVFVRPKSMFQEQVKNEGGEMVDRFTEI